jgi:TrmH family RNA methyltransferase
MGAHFHHMAFHASADLLDAYLDAQAIALWSTDAGGTSIETIRPPDRLAIAVGNEGAGISPELAARAAATVALPIQGVESLNVAVATGIVLYALRASAS